MQTLNWLESHIGTIEDAQMIVNDFFWFLNIDQRGEQWVVISGEEIVFTADSREAVDAFLYGMALAYKAFPPGIFVRIFTGMALARGEPILPALIINEEDYDDDEYDFE